MRKAAWKYAVAAWMAIAGLSGCSDYSGPVHVLNLGLRPDSATGAIIVSAHDNLAGIAKRYRLPIRGIIELNHLEPPYKLADGQRLKLPAPVDYRVRPQDTLNTVASMFSVSASRLAAVNNIPAPYRISPGQDLRIPQTYPQPAERIMAARKPSLSREERPTVNIWGESIAKKPQEKIVSRPLQPLTTPTSFVWPVRGKVISGYGLKSDGLFNDGVNIAAPRGTPVVAAADGVVAYVGNDLKSYGNLVLIRHGGGTMTAYAHLATTGVKKGMIVPRGRTVGIVGSTGSVPVSQLHFEIRHGSKTRDPRLYLR